MKSPAKRSNTANVAATRPATTAYAAQRYAHPFFVPAPPADRAAVDGHKRMTDWSKLQLGPIPRLAGKGVVDLAHVIGATGVKEIENLGELRFHALGDSGHGNAEDAQKVAEDMAIDFKPEAGALNPAFMLHLG